ncbi:TPA: kinase, partial [Streptococcus equi subsp. equi]|nr:kinase [Streptococcus equi subsp. equi]
VNAVPILIGPNGEQWQDFQKCYFDLPHWIEDLQEKQILLSSYLSENYQVESLLKQSNGGNIYKAIHLDTGKNVVIKECRSHIICTASISKKQLRDNEWNLSGLITNNIPKSIEKVHEWINDYYIYEYIDGQDLLDCCNEINLFSYKKRESEKNS